MEVFAPIRQPYNPSMRILSILCFFLAACSAVAVDSKPAKILSAEQVIAGFNQENKRIHIDVKNHWVEFDAKVCLQDAPMLEALVCTPMTREHESLLVSEAKPSQIHLALLLLGLEPGAPRSIRWVGPQGDQPMVVPAKGPEVELFFIFKTKVKTGEPGAEKEVEQEVEIPANQWLIDAKTKKESINDRWLFTGSRMIKDIEGGMTYMADGEGNIVSLVHFGDEVLAPHGKKTKENNSEGEDLVCNTPKIPAVGTPVKVRIKPVKVEKAVGENKETPQ